MRQRFTDETMVETMHENNDDYLYQVLCSSIAAKMRGDPRRSMSELLAVQNNSGPRGLITPERVDRVFKAVRTDDLLQLGATLRLEE